MITDPSIEEDLEANERGRQHGLAQFTYSEVEDMTGGFEKKIGEGGFAVVYHGCLIDGSKEVAVKVFSKNEAPKQFSTEVCNFNIIQSTILYWSISYDYL